MMRERTPFRRNTIEALPDLKLLITTGARNASIDMAAAAERGIDVCGTSASRKPDHRHRLRPDAGTDPPHRLRACATQGRRALGR